MDSVRSTSPVTFMSNMLYACSILYKYKLPFIVAMNKIDVVNHKYALDWMNDFEIFQAALASETSYASNLAQSMSLALDEFYGQLKAVGVSAMTGEGVDNFISAVREGREEYNKEYKVKQFFNELNEFENIFYWILIPIIKVRDISYINEWSKCNLTKERI